jgi:hypothetical protein
VEDRSKEEKSSGDQSRQQSTEEGIAGEGPAEEEGRSVEEEEHERNCRGTGKGNQFFGGLISLTVIDADDSLLAAAFTLSALAICAAATVACFAWTA